MRQPYVHRGQRTRTRLGESDRNRYCTESPGPDDDVSDYTSTTFQGRFRAWSSVGRRRWLRSYSNGVDGWTISRSMTNGTR